MRWLLPWLPAHIGPCLSSLFLLLPCTERGICPPAGIFQSFSLTFTVLAACTAPSVAVAWVREAGVGVVWMRRWILIRESHRPGCGSWVGEWSQSVLIGGTTGTIVIVKRQISHVYKKAEERG